MCGITGIYGNFSSLEEKIKGMNDALQHRGPDAEGYFFDPQRGLALGHRRLSILDLSTHANQPFHSKCGRYVMVYNGEVYNYKEIAQELDVAMTTHCDTEVIIEAYVKWGEAFIHKLNGMFALAIYDKQTFKLQLFRDRFGIKPLFYYFDGKNFGFASETKALFDILGNRELNLEAVKDYLFLEYIPNGQSIFKNVHKLKAGHKLSYTTDGVHVVKYYDLLDKFNPGEKNEQDSKEELKERIRKSVQMRRISDVPVGAFLSGGADSSLICAVFQENSDNPINSFNIGFDNAQFDESGYATEVANHLQTNHEMVRASQDESLKMLDHVIDFYDEPFASTSAFPTMLVCEKAKENVTVALSGDGGDELFMGYGYYRWMDRFNKVSSFGGYAARKLTASVLSLMDNRSKRAASVLDYDDPKTAWLHIWSQEQYMFSQKEISQLIGNEYKNQSLLDDWNEISQMDCHFHEKVSLFDIKNYLADNLLYKVDIASMRSSLEVRVPFLDHNVVEMALNLPVDYKIRGNEQKYIQKKILEDYLPSDLIYRQKWGFPAPISDWLKGNLSYLLEKTLNAKVIERQGIFNSPFIKKLKGDYLSGRDFLYRRIWALIFFQLWYKKNVDNQLF